MTVRRALLAVLALAVLVTVAGCGAASSTSSSTASSASSTSNVLRIPYLADMSVPDPDIFYDIEGNSVILSAYEGLLKYAPNSDKIVGDLATSWSESPDRLSYTFHLRPNVHFHDGTPFTAKSVIASFKRRLNVGQAPAYMVKPIASMSTPDPLTLVVKLKEPVDPFLDYLASSWGPKMIGPEAIVTHAGNNFGQTWLQTHDDGTGPYELTEFARGRQYVLTRYEGWWGPKPYFQKVLLKITPDISTQQLELESGSVDGIMHSFPAANLSSLPSSVKVLKYPSYLRLLLYVNTHKPPFNDPAVRATLRAAIDPAKLVAEAYSGTGTNSKGPFPEELLSNQPTLPYAPNPTVAADGVKKASTKSIVLGFTADESGIQRRVGEILQAALEAAGWQVTVKEVQLPQVYAYINNLGAAPDLLLQTNTPDAANADTWSRILFFKEGGLNFLAYDNPHVDALLERSRGAAPAESEKIEREVGQEVVNDNGIFFLGDIDNVFVLNKDLEGVEQTPAYPWTVNYASLRRAPG
jgi:peptide/nickel transport system substrate-binding protein